MVGGMELSTEREGVFHRPCSHSKEGSHSLGLGWVVGVVVDVRAEAS